MAMRLNQILFCGILVLSVFCLPAQATASTYNCKANESWITSPSMPKEVKKSGPGNTSTFCDFYQFSWQAFLYLMSPGSKGSATRNFEVNAKYPVLEFDDKGKPINSCDEKVTGNTFRVSLAKAESIPKIIGQAGDDATIYAQDGNVVYYEVKFNKGMCDVAKIKNKVNFPSGTTELKFAWKKLSAAEIKGNKFITIKTNVGKSKNITLGIVGMHVAVATKDHPEFVWSTFEHVTNVPNCTGALGVDSWLFTSGACNTALITKDKDKIKKCKFNQAKKATAVTSKTPTEICRVYPYGTATGDLKATENVEDITSLNANVNTLLAKSKSPALMSVLKNYFNVGAIWVSDIKKSSSDISNQRGSLRLANAVAETTFQNVDLDPKTNHGFASNCFGCHNYEGTGKAKNKNTTSGGLSHILDDIVVGSGQCIDVQAGPIWNDQDAKEKCSGKTGACQNSSSNLVWNGQWTTTETGVMSVCGCCGPKK